MILMEKKLALILGYRCNNNCRFCYCADKKDSGFLTTKRAKKELERGIKRGCTIADFSGGEPTLRKDLTELIFFAKKIGYKNIGITTNGRMMSYKKLTRRLTEAGMNSAVFSIHGHTPELHDFLTRVKGSYGQLKKGIDNLRNVSPGAYICTNTTINKYNYKYLPEIAENNIRLGAMGCEFIFVHPRGNALENFEEVVPKLTDLSHFIPKTLEIGEKNGIGHFRFRYLPLCYMTGHENSLSEAASFEILKEQHVGPDFKDLNVEKGRKLIGRIRGSVCKKCKVKEKCEGIFREYAERRGFGELKPVVR
ncbi:MAG: radical SAM protein [archaeon]|nr:MAG: radical SAM protein [archaeon]